MPQRRTSPSRRAERGMLQIGERSAGWLAEGSLDGRPVVLLAHGAGAPFTSAFMEATAAGLLARELAVVRFHFPYMQRHVDEGTRRPPDPMPVLVRTWAALLAHAAAFPGAGPLVLAGKSLGGRAASMLLAEGGGAGARGVVYLGYPLHAPGKSDRPRSAHLASVPVPQLFVSGTRDDLARLDLLTATVAGLGPAARLHLVEGGDHSLATSRGAPLAGADAWLDVVAAFVQEVAA